MWEIHETEKSSSFSRTDLVTLPRQRYSPAPRGQSFSVLYGSCKGSPCSPHTAGSLCPSDSPRCPLKVSQTGLFCFLDIRFIKSSSAGRNLLLGYNPALSVSNQMTKVRIVSQSSQRDVRRSRNSVSVLPSCVCSPGEHLAYLSFTVFYLPQPFCSSCLPNFSHFVRQNWKNKWLWEHPEGV